ncbi:MULTISPECIES: tetratricopeptide repeat protein [Sphingomonas]|uniref:Flp pilus assembly protein TadD n=1 Tax=Sphingomonas trueperi TaxID=53317 RepID=A0A7X5Y059_9SPHN|nr:MULTISPECIES: cytochrome c biogenesis factor-like protein [Sphingomonas]NJB98579.1 Flp pilus assembly protein TadD [Sphingomonas trueperi]
MIGWLVFGGFALLAIALLLLIRFPKRFWTVPAMAVMLAGAGYAWQGQPSLPDHPVEGVASVRPLDPDLIAAREGLFGRFNFDYSYFMAADAMTRAGAPQLAATVMLGAVRKAPNDLGLWAGLGLALSEHDGDQLSPAARYAFDKAETLAPNHPGPPFYRGVALARAGDLEAARQAWGKALRLLPPTASYRDDMVGVMLKLDPGLAAAARSALPANPPPAR